MSEDGDFSSIWFDESEDAFHGCGFPSAVRTEKPEHLSGSYAEIDRFEDVFAIEIFVERFYMNGERLGFHRNTSD